MTDVYEKPYDPTVTEATTTKPVAGTERDSGLFVGYICCHSCDFSFYSFP